MENDLEAELFYVVELRDLMTMSSIRDGTEKGMHLVVNLNAEERKLERDF